MAALRCIGRNTCLRAGKHLRRRRRAECRRTIADWQVQLNGFKEQSGERTRRPSASNAQIHARNRQQATIAALGLSAIASRDLGGFVDEVAARVADTLRTPYSGVLELRPDAGTLLLCGGLGWPRGVVGHHTVPTGPGSEVTFVLSSDRPVIVLDLRHEMRFERAPLLVTHSVVSALEVVIPGRSRPWGILGAYTTRRRSFSADDVRFLQSVSNVLAVAVERHGLEMTQRREQETLRTILDNMPVMISVYDASGHLMRANREWERVLGWTTEEAQQIDILAATYPEPRQRDEVVEFIQRAERQWVDFRPRTRDGRRVDVSWARFRLSDGSVIGFGLDVSDRKRVEAERERSLERERSARAEAERTLERLRAIQRITDSALVHLELDQLLQELLIRLRQALDTDYATVLLVEEGHARLYLRAGSGYEGVPSLRVPLGEGVSGWIAAEGRPLIVDDLSRFDLSGVEGFPAADILRTTESVMGAPLRVGTDVIGVVVVSSRRPRHFTEDDLELLLLVADRAAPAVDRARLHETIRSGREQVENLSRRLLAAQEEERRRLAVELHDELGQILTAIKINLESKRAAANARTQLEDAIASVNDAMDRVRDLALDLRPSVLDDLGLAAALRWYVDRFARETGADTHLSVDAVGKIDPLVEITCFRLAQEALTNVARHARATQVWFDVHVIGDELELKVRDDGTGFDVATARTRALAGASLGLLGMEERASLVRGRLEILSSPAKGTEVRAWFPLPASHRLL